MHWFLSLEDAYEKINCWVNEYNHFRPHSSLNEMTPVEFIEYHQRKDSNVQGLPAATIWEAMYFATKEYPATASENTYLPKQVLNPKRSPISPT
jgi:putative transposase